MKNWSVLAKSVFAVVGKIAVAVTPVRLAPLPANEPLNEPDKFELAPVNWSEVAPVIVVPSSAKDEFANAVPVHFGILLSVSVEAPATETVAVAPPS